MLFRKRKQHRYPRRSTLPIIRRKLQMRYHMKHQFGVHDLAFLQTMHALTGAPLSSGNRVEVNTTFAGGPIGKVLEGDLLQIIVDRNRLEGSVDLVGVDGKQIAAEEGTRILASRSPRADLHADPNLPADTRLWAALQAASGGTWGGCVYDAEAIVKALKR